MLCNLFIRFEGITGEVEKPMPGLWKELVWRLGSYDLGKFIFLFNFFSKTITKCEISHIHMDLNNQLSQSQSNYKPCRHFHLACLWIHTYVECACIHYNQVEASTHVAIRPAI